MDWLEDLKRGFKGDIADDEETIAKYSRDASIFEVRPKLVVFPKDAEDVKHLVKFARTHRGFSLTARAAGTDMTGGPLTNSIVVSFTKYINKLVRMDKRHAIVEP